MSKNIEFSLNDLEQKRFDEWKEKIKDLYGECGSFRFTFSHTGIEYSVVVYSELANSLNDITDYKSW